jgi:hypothetical protein
MKDFSFYDQTGLVIPGAVLPFGAIILFPKLRVYFDKDGITIGGLGLFLLLALCGWSRRWRRRQPP